MSDEKLGTCEAGACNGKFRHVKQSGCVSWREQPAQGEPRTGICTATVEKMRASGEGMSAVANYAMCDDWADRAANLIFSRIHLGDKQEPNFTIRKVTVEAWAELIRREWTATFGTGNIRPKPVEPRVQSTIGGTTGVTSMSAEQFYATDKSYPWPVYRWPNGSAVFKFAEAYSALTEMEQGTYDRVEGMSAPTDEWAEALSVEIQQCITRDGEEDPRGSIAELLIKRVAPLAELGELREERDALKQHVEKLLSGSGVRR